MKRGAHTNRGGNPQNIFGTVIPLFRRCHGAKTWTFCNISVITEDIYLKLGLVVIMKRGTHTNRGGNPQKIFGTVMPLFRLRIFVEKWFHCDFSRTDG